MWHGTPPVEILGMHSPHLPPLTPLASNGIRETQTIAIDGPVAWVSVSQSVYEITCSRLFVNSTGYL